MQEKQIIGLLNDSFPPQIDGVANAVVNYGNILHARGFSPVVVTPALPEAEDSPFPYPILRYPSMDTRKGFGYMSGIPFSPSVAKRLDSVDVAVLHSHCPFASNFMGRALRNIVNAPLILTYHTRFEIDLARAIKSVRLQNSCKKILAENINACDEVWIVSEGTAQSLRSLGYEGDYIVMPNGVDVPRSRLSPEQVAAYTEGYDLPEGVPIYLFVGRMRWYKGIRLILDALAALKAKKLPYRMVFVGDGSDLPEIQSYARQLGLEDACIFTGAIRDREALRGWYARANLFLFPSTYDTNGLVVREAAASSLPSVLIAGSCASDGTTHNRNCFQVEENAQSLAACLLDLYGKEDYLRTIGEAASRELYLSWEDAVDNALKRYDVVIDRYKSGFYPKRYKPVDNCIHLNAKLMEALSSLPFSK